MTHELKKIVAAYQEAKTKKLGAVLATVVALDGSSYRRPGVRMLILENGDSIGAVSGGCVEKEIIKQSLTVFKTKTPKVIVYDGRYRLGCEGILYVLLESFHPNDSWITAFWKAVKSRSSITIKSYYQKSHGENAAFGSLFYFDDTKYPLTKENPGTTDTLCYEQQLPPCFKLLILGAEHDAVQLSAFAALAGWEVVVVSNPREEKSLADFPGASKMIQAEPEDFQPAVDQQTAVVLMTHSFVKDLQFLIGLRNENPIYLGVLGPAKRREQLFNELLERYPMLEESFLDGVHGPAGLHIGAETPQEIALSILSEILSVSNGKTPIPLKEKTGSIHN